MLGLARTHTRSRWPRLQPVQTTAQRKQKQKYDNVWRCDRYERARALASQSDSPCVQLLNLLLALIYYRFIILLLLCVLRSILFRSHLASVQMRARSIQCTALLALALWCAANSMCFELRSINSNTTDSCTHTDAHPIETPLIIHLFVNANMRAARLLSVRQFKNYDFVSMQPFSVATFFAECECARKDVWITVFRHQKYFAVIWSLCSPLKRQNTPKQYN